MSEPYMKFYPGDYLGDTMHLNIEEHGAYLKLLMCMWRAGGWLPDDDKRVCQMLGVGHKKWEKIKAILLPFFIYQNGGFTQQRLLRERISAEELSKKNSISGGKGGKAKALNNNETHLANATKSLEKNPSENLAYPEPEPYTELSSLRSDSSERARAPEPETEIEKTENPKTKKSDPPPKRAQRIESAHSRDTFPGDYLRHCEEKHPCLDPPAVWDRFFDHWSAKGGADAAKRDWFATWRTWCKNAEQYGQDLKPGENHVSTTRTAGRPAEPTKADRAKAAIIRGLESIGHDTSDLRQPGGTTGGSG